MPNTMHTSFTASEVEQFRRNAKRIARAQSVPLHQALDQIAVTEGFSNWSLLVKHSGPSLPEGHAPQVDRPTRLDTPQLGSRRRYLHGDQGEGEPKSFYCARCDIFTDSSHFAKHGPHTGEDYLNSLESWKQGDWLAKLDWPRPENAVNILEAPALAARAQYQALRPVFSSWLKQQRTRRDNVGMFALGVVSRRGLPATPNSIRNLQRHYEKRGLQRSEVEGLYQAWDEFLVTNEAGGADASLTEGRGSRAGRRSS